MNIRFSIAGLAVAAALFLWPFQVIAENELQKAEALFNQGGSSNMKQAI